MDNTFSKYSPFILRTGIAIAFLWFGFSQLANSEQWVRMIPSYVSFIPFSPTALIYAHGAFEIVLATLLLLGLYTRVTSFLLALNIFHITYLMGYGATGARDLAIAIATLSIFVRGPDEYCLDYVRSNREGKNAARNSS